MNVSLIIPCAPGSMPECLEVFKSATHIELLIEEGVHPSINRNRGINRSNGEIVAFTNCHTVIPSDWIDTALKFFEEHPSIDILGGPQLTPIDDPFFAKAVGDVMTSPFATATMRYRYRPGKINLDADEKLLCSANLFCRKKVFECILFNEKLYPGEDPDFFIRAKQKGFKLAYCPNLVVYNRRRNSPVKFFIQNFKYGMVRTYFPVNPFTHHFLALIPMFFCIYLLVLTFIDFLFYMPLFLYTILLLLFSVILYFEMNILKRLILYPFLFFMIHFSYGMGMIFGYTKRLLTLIR